MTPLRLQAAALASSLSHVLIDFGIGLYGTGAQMSALQAANMAAYAAVYGFWGWALVSAHGLRSAVVVLLTLSAVWSAIGQGVVGIRACRPPCGADVVGFQDLSHLLSLGFGG